MSSLTPEQIALLLQQEAEQPTGRSRGPKVDPTADRTINGWYKLQHHICLKECEHRVDERNPTSAVAENGQRTVGNACWNVDCMDHTRNKETDRGANIVAEVKTQYICRYCYLGGYLEQ